MDHRHRRAAGWCTLLAATTLLALASHGQDREADAGSVLQGRVFVDADEDGMFQAGREGGLVNVQVRVVDGSGRVRTAVTDASGRYQFVLAAGAYTVSVDTTDQAGRFNGALGTWWRPTTALAHEVTVPSEAVDLDVGFKPEVDAITEDLVDDGQRSSGASPGFWINELYWAITPEPLPAGFSDDSLPSGEPVYKPEQMLAFLRAIEQLALDEPFQFSDGQEFAETLLILAADADSPLAVLSMELLARELDHVSGRGVADNQAMAEAMIIWGESMVVHYADEIRRRQEAGGDLSRGQSEALSRAIGFFHVLNVGGGGGFDE